MSSFMGKLRGIGIFKIKFILNFLKNFVSLFRGMENCEGKI